jgi:hypothetical protein
VSARPQATAHEGATQHSKPELAAR